MASEAPEPLVCVECGRHADGEARGWRGVLAAADEDDARGDEVEGVLFFCPACAAREFGERVTDYTDR